MPSTVHSKLCFMTCSNQEFPELVLHVLSAYDLQTVSAASNGVIRVVGEQIHVPSKATLVE